MAFQRVDDPLGVLLDLATKVKIKASALANELSRVLDEMDKNGYVLVRENEKLSDTANSVFAIYLGKILAPNQIKALVSEVTRNGYYFEHKAVIGSVFSFSKLFKRFSDSNTPGSVGASGGSVGSSGGIPEPKWAAFASVGKRVQDSVLPSTVKNVPASPSRPWFFDSAAKAVAGAAKQGAAAGAKFTVKPKSGPPVTTSSGSDMYDWILAAVKAGTFAAQSVAQAKAQKAQLKRLEKELKQGEVSDEMAAVYNIRQDRSPSILMPLLLGAAILGVGIFVLSRRKGR